jgi:hypothetical protein
MFIVVYKPAVNMTFTVSPTEVVTLTADFPDNPALTGTVKFMNGGMTLAVVSIPNGRATCKVNNPSLGEHFLRAIFSGNEQFDQREESQNDTIVKWPGRRGGVRS